MKTFDEALMTTAYKTDSEPQEIQDICDKYTPIMQEISDNEVAQQMLMAMVQAVVMGEWSLHKALNAAFQNGVRIGIEMEKP